GEGALLCGPAAAFLHGLLRSSAPPPPAVWARTERLVEGVRVRRARSPLDAGDGTLCRGIPVTTVPRTLVDLAAHLSLGELARACHEADVKHGTVPGDVEEVLARRPRSKGARNLRRVLHGDVPVTLSALERRFLLLLHEHGLPLPLTNRLAGSRRVDCRWPRHRLTVELDSYRYHSSRHSWEQDRRRDREARLRGDEIRRYTYGDVYENPAPMLRELVTLLAKRPG
ncbi:MAG TPA: hypothetical protein VHF89_03355, partial [Solirubrobacteraceae bacterium]|nr:hypothetical protein [Solirubrobacteraceae bacterium]